MSSPGWKTRGQLMKLHGDAETVNKLIDEKTKSHQYKEHPEIPGEVMYFVLIDLEKVEEDEHEDKLSMSISGEARGEQVWPPLSTTL